MPPSQTARAVLLTGTLLYSGLLSCAGAPGPGSSAAAANGATGVAADVAAVQQTFFENLQRRCGRSFEGATELPPDPAHPMAGKRLVLNLGPCSESEVRVNFQVGEDVSRTWIITLSSQGLLLKHDHRHPDGTPDEVTDYGGWALAENDEVGITRQRFAADEHTARLIPEAATNVWTLELDPAASRLVYALERHGQPRYRASFRLLPAG